MLREYIAQQRAEQGYRDYLQQKVARARRSVEQSAGRLNAEVAPPVPLR
ncbi:hypothetical protein Acaty_c1053 [Acidithiobacillus caldus ATCC 51756]|uniref:Uncharacterized protein n=1 Tax=Acidithiobacillus caldus (strain ATCC 51756 / DSM 8584 / KU) TaxID=637389 RepID=A0A059ZTH7_ACICK|nr:hypothetical protein Acaty_c1053 [Acidithiobacillus caldus ATCC 51756]